MNFRAVMLSLLLLLLATSALFAGSGLNSDEARKLVREGLELLKSGDADAALAKFRDAQVELPESHRLHYNVGLALYRAERYEEAAKAFELAAASSDREVEKRARLQIGNCAIKSGRYEEALDSLNRALEIDGAYAEARANREWVIRKMAELARKKMEQEQKQAQERRFIEKLQEIVGKQTQAHLALRVGMIRRELDLRPTRVERLDEVLDAPLAAKPEDLGSLNDDEEVALFARLLAAQTELRESLAALVQEGKERVDAARAAQASSGGAAGGPPPAAGASPMAMPVDPDAAKIALALPYLNDALPQLDRARELAEEESWNLHAPQEEGLIQLLRALDELLDELTLIIQDELQLLKDTLKLAKSQEAAAEEEEVRNRALELGTRQAELRERTQAIAKAIEGQVQAVSTGGGTPVGQDPEEAAKRLRTALGHLVAATGHMEEAASDLAAQSPKPASEDEKLALEELVKARAALQPPQEKSGEKGDKGDEKEQKQDPSEEGESDDQKKKGEEKDDSKGNEGERGEEGADQEGGGDGEEKKSEKDESKSGKMSPEQAKQMLQRAAQRERDRRAENKEKGRRVQGGGRRGVKDW
jgi:tetratricopeptide (TPR) repeat protein